MLWLKRIGAILGLLAVVAVIAYFALKHYAETYSFAPDDPEQSQLAAEHAQCAGYYRVLRSALKNTRPDYADLERQYTQELEHHAKMGLNFSPDKEMFKTQVEKATSRFGEDVLAAAKTEKVSDLVDERMKHCFDIVFRSGDFVKRKLEEKRQ
jgi:hypothetical protein